MKAANNKHLPNGSANLEKDLIPNHKAIGGYFEWEINSENSLYYDQLVKLNKGRSALEYILRNQKYKKLYIPYFICDAILQPLIKLNLDYEFYHIDAQFRPKIEDIETESAVLFVNYFGLMNNKLSGLKQIYRELIVDNSMAFFSRPMESIHAFYSPRKFFGVPDGGFAFVSGNTPPLDVKQDVSYTRTAHLLKRLDVGAELGYEDFKKNESASDRTPMMKMSNLTQKILKSIHYEKIRQIRTNNFLFLHRHLSSLNELSTFINQAVVDGPMSYPFLKKNNSPLRKRLLENRIYVPQYWPNITRWVHAQSLEFYMYANTLPLPVDQRYDEKDMEIVVRLIKNYL